MAKKDNDKYIVTKRPGEKAVVVEYNVDIINSDSVRKHLDDSWFTIAHCLINDEPLDIWCDDEGLFKKLPYNFWHSQLSQPIVGPVFVCACNGNGESIPISKKLAEATAAWLDENS